MIVGNLYHIKQTNGLFYYGADYLRACAGKVRKILVRPALVKAARAELPDIEVVACSFLDFVRQAVGASLRGDFLYTPTSHPLPGLSRQWIVIHDTYPFSTGSKGRLKERLLRWSLATSDCRVAYINESDVLPFVAGLGVAADRRIFAPNRFPSTPPATERHVLRGHLTVGLVGTDSAKKNYAALFEEVRRTHSASQLRFQAYGHATPYLSQLRKDFPDIEMELLESDLYSLEEFFARIDLLTSVATQEGFGRPLAAALLAGVPCLLLDRTVFREFFDPGASFFPDPHAVVQALRAVAIDQNLSAVTFRPPRKAVDAYTAAIDNLIRAGGAAT